MSSTPLQASFSIAKICTGAGVLALPHVFDSVGFSLGAAGVLFILILNSISVRLLLRCKEAMPEGLLYSSSDTLAAVAQFALGPYCVHLVHISLIITLMGVCAVYFITVGSLLHEAFPHFSALRYTLMSAFVLIPFCFISDLSKIAWTSLLGLTCYVTAIGIIFTYGFTQYSIHWSDSMLFGGLFEQDGHNPHHLLAATGWTAVMQFLGVISFSIGIPVLAYQLQESMSEPDKFEKTVDITLAIVGFVFIFIGVFGVLLFGPVGVQPMIISNLPKESTYALGVRIVMSAMLLASFPLSFVPALNMFDAVLCVNQYQRPNYRYPSVNSPHQKSYVLEDADVVHNEYDHEHHPLYTNQREYGMRAYNERGSWGTGGDSDSDENNNYLDRRIDIEGNDPRDDLDTHADRGEKLQRYGVRIGALLVTTLIAIGVPCFTLVMSLIGCITIGILSFVLPPIFYLQFAKKVKGFSSGLFTRIGCTLFAIFGIFLMCTGTLLLIVHGKCE